MEEMSYNVPSRQFLQAEWRREVTHGWQLIKGRKRANSRALSGANVVETSSGAMVCEVQGRFYR